MRYLAIDLGAKRTGLAVGDDETRIASPLRTLEIPSNHRDRLIAAIGQAAVEEQAGALVLGLPLNMDDSEGPAAKQARAFATELGAALDLPIHVQDERLTSADADWSMAQSGLTHKQKKERRDAIAAAAVLRDFFERGGGNESS